MVSNNFHSDQVRGSAEQMGVDVVDHAAEREASELSAALAGLPREERLRILKVVRLLAEK